ncbi:MAG: sporulation integral membrane protein YtvI [Oscillospiraceae bacterium]|nr:sporulation integral membrane protein YtvI [Oscillospiraceae bacterium]
MRSGTKGALSFLTVFLIVWLGMRYLLPLCFPFLLGTGLALLAEPIVRFFCKRLHFPRAAAAGIGVTAAFLSVALLFLLVCAFLVRELGMLAGILPDLTQTAQSGLSLLQSFLLKLVGRLPQSIRPFLEQNVDSLFSGGTALLDRAFRYVLGLAGTILTHVPDSALSLGTGVISGFMISAKLPRIHGWLRRHLPREKLRPLLQTLSRMKNAVGCWLMAQVKLAGMTLVLLAAGLLILRIPYALIWALGVALVDAVPVLGTGTVLLPWSLICFLQGDRARCLGLLGLYGVISLTRSVLEPKLVGKELGLDPLVTLFALYAGYKLWGIGGMIIAPLLAVTAIQLVAGKRDASL